MIVRAKAWFILLLLLCGTGCSAPGAAAPERRFDYAQVIMGVRVNIAAYCRDEVKARSATRAAFDEMALVDGVLTDYRRDSESMRLCDAAGSGPVPVSDLLAEVLRRSLEFSQASGGAFDVTVGPVVRLWRIARKTGKEPDAGALAEARERVGWQRVTLGTNAEGKSTVSLASPGMRLDFGAIGKGYAADRGMAVMRRMGVPRCLIAAAGDIAAGDAPPGRDGWRIAISDGDSEEGEIVVANRGVSTSGDTQQFVEIGAVRYSHIVDPKTGVAETRRSLVTTVAPDATTADAAATTLSVLDTPGHGGFLRHFAGLEARVRVADGAGFRETVTPGFPPIRRGP